MYEARFDGVGSRIRWIRCGKTTGFGRFLSRHFTLNQAWLELSLTATDLLAWTQTLLLEGELATAEPKKLRYRLLHEAARITPGGRRLRLRIAANLALAARTHQRLRSPHRITATGHLTCGNVPAHPPPRNPLETGPSVGPKPCPHTEPGPTAPVLRHHSSSTTRSETGRLVRMPLVTGLRLSRRRPLAYF